jgi:radical SAM protein with 4Fe4S-binding SPASM domain
MLTGIKAFFTKPTDIEPGLHHFLLEDGGYRSRVHLRIDPDGHGTLIINANRVVHLNPTAALMAFLSLTHASTSKAVKAIQHHYRVGKSQALHDYTKFRADLDQILQPGSCPVCAIDNLEISAPFSSRPTAPYRMDLALTYRCNNDCSHCYNDRPRNYPELTTQEWKRIIDRVWELGIPHIVFTGGEPTLRDDLPELIAHAETNGQITGLNSNGRRLKDKHFVDSLVEAGLDHVQITVESYSPDIHDHLVAKKGAWAQTIAGLENVLNTPLYVMTNTTLLQSNKPYLSETLDFLAKEGVPTVGLNALIYSGKGLTVGTGLKESELPQLLDIARSKTDRHNQRLIWYTPTQYCQFDPTQLELGVKGCTAALYNMCVEPDGGVIPCQSYYLQLGKILTDPWDAIWNHQVSIRLREREFIPDECRYCDLLPECGGGCPLALEAQENHLIDIKRIAIIKDW